MKFSNCIISFQSSNDKKPIMRIDHNGLFVQPICTCGSPLPSTIFSGGTDKLILEKIHMDFEDAENRGLSKIPLRVQQSKTLHEVCAVCSRDFVGILNFTLESRMLRNFLKSKEQDEKEAIFAENLLIHAEFKGGYFREFEKLLLATKLLSPTCLCTHVLTFPEINQKFDEMVKAVSDYYQEDSERPRDIIDFVEQVKCPLCLSKHRKLKISLRFLLPENAKLSQAIKLANAWKNRQNPSS